MISTPSARYWPCTRRSTGNSLRHGIHHEAQKFTTTPFPRRSLRRILPPPRRRGRSKSGAMLPAAATPGDDTTGDVWVDSGVGFDDEPPLVALTQAATPTTAE